MDMRRANAKLIIIICFLALSVPFMAAPNPRAYANNLWGNAYGAGGEGGGEATLPPISEQLRELAGDNHGSYGIYLNVLETGEQAGYQEDEAFYAASCYKLFLVMYIYEEAARGEADLNRTITYQAGDVEGEEGVIKNRSLGTAFTTRELCSYAIVYSDNVAARMLKRVYGYHAFRDYARSIGCPVAGTYNINSTTAREMGILLMRVLQFAQTDLLGQEVIAYLEEGTGRSGIPAGLPQGVKAGNKTGYYQGFVNDAAVVFLDDLTYILCVLSEGAPGFSVHAEASRLVYEDISRRYYPGGTAARSYQPSQQWFFAQASTAVPFETWLCLSNPDKSTAITYIRPEGDVDNGERRICVPPRSTVSLRLNQLFGTGRDFALAITCDIPILAERARYYTHRGGWALESSKTGACGAVMERYVAEGRTSGEMEAWLYLFNAGELEAHAVVVTMAAGGRSVRHAAVIPAHAKVSLLLNDLSGADPGTAVCVLSDTPIFAEQAVYMK